jgi:hypothetical protein
MEASVMMKIGRRVAGALALLLTALPISAAEISVPALELSTTGSVQDGAFVLATRAVAELSVDGGYKFGGTLRFSFSANDLEKALAYLTDPLEPASSDPTASDYNVLVDRINNSSSLSFRLAKVLIREPFGFPLEFAYFVGRADTFCSGDEFPARFGSAPIGSAFRGFAYFPDGINGDPNYQYDGIHAVTGTGFSVSLNAWSKLVPMLYVYQDSALAADSATTGRFSGDFRILGNGKRIKLEAFAGMTVPYGKYGIYRAGALGYFTTGAGASFLAQIGIPRWDPEETFGIDNLFFLFEPRVDFGFTSVIMTLFYHPAWYLQRATNERGVSDINFKFLIGDLQKTSTEGGIETTIGIHGDENSADEPFRISVGPFFAMLTEVVRWDLKIKIDPLSYTVPMEMTTVYLGVRTAF